MFRSKDRHFRLEVIVVEAVVEVSRLTLCQWVTEVIATTLMVAVAVGALAIVAASLTVGIATILTCATLRTRAALTVDISLRFRLQHTV